MQGITVNTSIGAIDVCIGKYIDETKFSLTCYGSLPDNKRGQVLYAIVSNQMSRDAIATYVQTRINAECV